MSRDTSLIRTSAVIKMPSGNSVKIPMEAILGPAWIICAQVDPYSHGPLSNSHSAFLDFCERMKRTHTQMRCPTCGKFTVWNRRKPENKS